MKHFKENSFFHWHIPLEIIMSSVDDFDIICAGTECHLHKNDILILCSGTIHSILPEHVQSIDYHFDSHSFQQYGNLETILSIISPFLVITKGNAASLYQHIEALLLTIDAEYKKEPLFAEVSIHSMLLQIFVYIGRYHTDCVAHNMFNYVKAKEYTAKFLMVCNYINDHCTEDLSLDDIAKLSGYSKYHFSRLFKHFTGISFYKYLNRRRINTAERLLIDSRLTVNDVALRSGYSSMSTFIRMFHIVKNCTPKEFKSMYHPL